MADLVEVFRPATLAEAIVIESMLGAYGIVGYIANQNLCRIVPLARDLPGFGMRVMVDARDAILLAVPLAHLRLSFSWPWPGTCIPCGRRMRLSACRVITRCIESMR